MLTPTTAGEIQSDDGKLQRQYMQDMTISMPIMKIEHFFHAIMEKMLQKLGVLKLIS